MALPGKREWLFKKRWCLRYAVVCVHETLHPPTGQYTQVKTLEISDACWPRTVCYTWNCRRKAATLPQCCGGGTPQPDLERRHALTGRYRVATRVAYPGCNSAPPLEVGTVDSGIAHSHGYVEYMCRLYDKQ